MRTFSAKHYVVFLCALFCCPGCASLKNRGRDLTDIFSLALEYPGEGAKRVGPNLAIQAGPVLVGAGFVDKGAGAGLRSGASGDYTFTEVNRIISGSKELNLEKDTRRKEYFAEFGFSSSAQDVDELWWGSPFALLAMFGMPIVTHVDGFKAKTRVLTQVEASLMMFGGIRAGINIAETADFVFGWAGVDFLEDDL